MSPQTRKQTQLSSPTHWAKPSARRFGVAGGYVVRVDLAGQVELAKALRRRRTQRGAFCGEWLPYCAVNQGSWLRQQDGTTGRLPRAAAMAEARVLGDVVAWT